MNRTASEGIKAVNNQIDRIIMDREIVISIRDFIESVSGVLSIQSKKSPNHLLRRSAALSAMIPDMEVLLRSRLPFAILLCD